MRLHLNGQRSDSLKVLDLNLDFRIIVCMIFKDFSILLQALIEERRMYCFVAERMCSYGRGIVVYNNLSLIHI